MIVVAVKQDGKEWVFPGVTNIRMDDDVLRVCMDTFEFCYERPVEFEQMELVDERPSYSLPD